VITEISDNNETAFAGWVFYDGECAMCIAGAERFARTLAGRGFRLAPLQTTWVRDRLGLYPDDPLEEMRLLLPDKRALGGADVVIYLAGHIWWAWPLYLFAQLPGAKRLLWKLYRWIAANRNCHAGQCRRTLTANHEVHS
jgi:predicted DCC family thiol-disulfide oxidoreductase YuxK